jgi:hypothetical protein
VHPGKVTGEDDHDIGPHRRESGDHARRRPAQRWLLAAPEHRSRRRARVTDDDHPVGAVDGREHPVQ